MNNLKFELSVLFTKTNVGPYTRNDLIIEEYSRMFGKEISDEEISNIVGEIINDQIEMYNYNVQEIPDDYELNDTNR